MKRLSWQVYLGIVFVLISVCLYLLHYAIFEDSHHIFIFLVADIAFVPIEVLFVTLIIHRVLNAREKRSMMEKLNMVIGTFFSEIGTDLLNRLAEFDPDSDANKKKLIVAGDWSDQDFVRVGKEFHDYDYQFDGEKKELKKLQSFLLGKRNFMLRLLENPNLLEHDDFTDLLWAVFHLLEELGCRTDLKTFSDSDYLHLIGDIKRAYRLLIAEWLLYMKHLKNSYPYLFSLAIRVNPLDDNASPEVS